MAATILPIQPGSDGDDSRRPTADGFRRSDGHYLERLAGLWAKDRGLPSGVTYRLDKLPNGYAGYEKTRGNDITHVDRYVYGHEKGT